MYPCKCNDMVWIVDNYDVFVKDNDKWVLKWIELDRVGNRSKINIEKFGARFKYCLFCGKKIKD